MDNKKVSVLFGDYEQFDLFTKAYPSLDGIHFDSYVTGKLSLLALPESFDFHALEARLDMISAALPAMIRIFEKPIIHLKETEDVMPIEAVRKLNSHSIRYAAEHSDTWEGYDESGIKPRKLLTRRYEDNYSIYENTLFACSVDLSVGSSARSAVRQPDR